jgi:phage recombination protein Bet
MTSTAVAMLPTDGDSKTWSAQEKALVEAAGLVRVVNKNTGEKALADRPTVEAFLQHCRRTQLDPIARQIYAIYRAGKWGIQVSIDGARLVAERTGKYRGQTTPEFTGDGKTWTEVWLEDQPPKAARVGVHHADFAAPLYAIALWSAYAVYQDEWENNRKTGNQTLSAMWKKMGPLMLAKCAEMLALRKAFPQDLSGLYSTEEMDQAGGVREVVKQAEKTAYKSQVTEQPGIDGEVEYEVVRGQTAQAPIAPPELTKDWKGAAALLTTVEQLTELANEADRLGEIGIVVSEEDGKVIDVLRARRAVVEKAAVTPPMVDVPRTTTGRRQWVREARSKTMRSEVAALVQEATAVGALVQIIEELEAIARSLPDEEIAQEVTDWPVAEVPKDEAWAGEQPPVEVEF